MKDTKVTRAVTWTLWGLLVLYAASFSMVYIASRLDTRHDADVIAVLGAAHYNGRPSPVFKARLDHAALLFDSGYSHRVAVTGGTAEGDRESEAIVGQRYLESKGVPDSAAFAVPEGRDTQASMAALANWMGERGYDTAVLVSDPFHLLRLRLEARRHHLTVYTSPTRTSPISYDWRAEMSYFASEAVKIPVAWFRSW